MKDPALEEGGDHTMPHTIFRQSPPKELVSQFLQTCGLQSIEDLSPFTKSHIQVKTMETLLPELEQYYIPCKAEEYLHNPLTQIRALTILRQILKPHDITLQTTEKSTGGKKITWYSIQKVLEVTTGEVEVKFD
jgi:hypothetical protein